MAFRDAPRIGASLPRVEMKYLLGMGDGKDNILHDFRHQVGKGLDEMGIEDDHLTVHKKL